MSQRKCPICGKPRHADHSPFCSNACRDRDFLQWVSDGYALPGAPDQPMAGAEDDGREFDAD